MEFGFRNYGATMSLSDFEIVAQTRAKVLYSIPGLMVIHFESVRLKKMSMTLENLVKMMSPMCFEIVAQIHERLLYSFLTQIFFNWMF